MGFSALQIALIAVPLLLIGSFLSLDSKSRDLLTKRVLMVVGILILIVAGSWATISAIRWAWYHPLF